MKKRGLRYNRISKTISNLNENEDFLTELEFFIKDYKNKKEKSLPKIPIGIFSNKKLGILEILVKYLKENYLMTYSKIAKLLNRDDRTIWSSYNKTKKKV